MKTEHISWGNLRNAYWVLPVSRDTCACARRCLKLDNILSRIYRSIIIVLSSIRLKIWRNICNFFFFLFWVNTPKALFSLKLYYQLKSEKISQEIRYLEWIIQIPSLWLTVKEFLKNISNFIFRHNTILYRHF